VSRVAKQPAKTTSRTEFAVYCSVVLVYTILINELLSLDVVNGEKVTRVKQAALRPPYMIMPIVGLSQRNQCFHC
jgi:hypothetical protein